MDIHNNTKVGSGARPVGSYRASRVVLLAPSHPSVGGLAVRLISSWLVLRESGEPPPKEARRPLPLSKEAEDRSALGSLVASAGL